MLQQSVSYKSKNLQLPKSFLVVLLYIGATCSCVQAQTFNLHIEGKTKAQTHKIDSIGYQSSFDSFQGIRHETDGLLKKLHRQGYINVEHTPLTKQNDTVFYTKFSLGTRYTDIRVVYSSAVLSPKTLRKFNLKHTDRSFSIPFTQVEQTLKTLNTYMANQGRPFSSLQLTGIKPINEHTLSGRLTITGGKERKIDSIVIKGYDKFPRAFMTRFIGIKKGQLFDKSKLDQKTEQLKNLSFVKAVRKPEVLFTEDQTTLYFYLKKQDSNHFEGFLGFSTDKESKHLQLDGNISLSLVNNLNYGEALTLHYKNNGADQQRFTAALKLPYVFSSPFGLKLGLDIFRQDTTYTTTKQSAQVTYQINARLGLEAGYKGTRSNSLLEDPTLVGQVNKDYQANFFLLGGNYLQRNALSPLFPITSEAHLSFGIGRRKFETGGSPQQEIEFTGQQLFTLDRRNRIFVANETSVLFSDDYVDNELFRFGGIHSIRGFEENSLSASFYSSFQTEYRYLLSSNLYLHSIIDAAHLENARQHTTNTLYGIGFGLGLKTKAGLLKVAFANGKTKDQNFEFNNTKVHLSLTASF